MIIQQTDFFQVGIAPGENGFQVFLKSRSIRYRIKMQEFDKGITATACDPTECQVKSIEGCTTHQSKYKTGWFLACLPEFRQVFVHVLKLDCRFLPEKFISVQHFCGFCVFILHFFAHFKENTYI